MGWRDRRAIKRAEQEAREAHEEAARESARRAIALSEWQAELDRLKQLLADTYAAGEHDVPGLVEKKGEEVFLMLSGGVLVEPRREKGQYVGGSQGVSIRIAKGVSYRVGANRGTFVAGDEVPTIIDEGTVYVTNRRVAFVGPKQTREWAFAKLISVDHADDQPLTLISVSNRQKTSGIGYDTATADQVRFRIDLALAHFNDALPQLRASIEQAIAGHTVAAPVTPGPTDAAVAPD